MILCLLLAALLGFIIGYLFGRSSCSDDIQCGSDDSHEESSDCTTEEGSSAEATGTAPLLLSEPRNGEKDNLTRN